MCVCVFPADDGKLSLDEFQAFFSDGTLNEEELEKLFHTIDSDNTRSVQPRSYYVVALGYSMYKAVCVHDMNLHRVLGYVHMCVFCVPFTVTFVVLKPMFFINNGEKNEGCTAASCCATARLQHHTV